VGAVLRATLIVGCIVAGACGRIGFDPLGGSGNPDGDGGAPGDGRPMLSCVGLGSTCGASGTSPCCESPVVPGGTFFRSYDVGTDARYTNMTNPATVSDFRFDTYEVTVRRFRQFVNAGMGTQQQPPSADAGARRLNGMANQGGWDPTWNANLTTDTTALVNAVKCSPDYQSWTNLPGANEDLPMNCLTWFEAFAFCVWDGGFLPTEAEWNYAAAGGDEQRAYPWSSPPSSLAIDCSYANYFIDMPAGMHCVGGGLGAMNRVGSESPKGDGKYGQADLAGNAWEWTLDWYQATYPNPCDDCVVLAPGSDRVFRGGNFFFDAISLRGAFRFRGLSRSFDLGVRCARTP